MKQTEGEAIALARQRFSTLYRVVGGETAPSFFSLLLLYHVSVLSIESLGVKRDPPAEKRADELVSVLSIESLGVKPLSTIGITPFSPSFSTLYRVVGGETWFRL